MNVSLNTNKLPHYENFRVPFPTSSVVIVLWRHVLDKFIRSNTFNVNFDVSNSTFMMQKGIWKRCGQKIRDLCRERERGRGREVVSNPPPPRLTSLFGEISIPSRYVYIALKKGKKKEKSKSTLIRPVHNGNSTSIDDLDISIHVRACSRGEIEDCTCHVGR